MSGRAIEKVRISYIFKWLTGQAPVFSINKPPPSLF